jgi:hypothetical protein
LRDRIRWGNVARAGGLAVLAAVIVAWPALSPREPALPPAQPVPVAPAEPSGAPSAPAAAAGAAEIDPGPAGGGDAISPAPKPREAAGRAQRRGSQLGADRARHPRGGPGGAASERREARRRTTAGHAPSERREARRLTIAKDAPSGRRLPSSPSAPGGVATPRPVRPAPTSASAPSEFEPGGARTPAASGPAPEFQPG